MFKISAWFAPLARRVLYAWVKATVFAEAASGVDPARPVVYVLQDRHLSNLLVLFEESKRAGLPPAETALAVGDVRANPVKRVAAAVGEGSMAIAFVHQFLAHQQATPAARAA